MANEKGTLSFFARVSFLHVDETDKSGLRKRHFLCIDSAAASMANEKERRGKREQKSKVTHPVVHLPSVRENRRSKVP
jgi:hypothetical protein